MENSRDGKTGARVEVAGRLIGEEADVIVGAGPHDGRALLPASGELIGPMPDAVLEPVVGQELEGSCLSLRAREIGGRDGQFPRAPAGGVHATDLDRPARGRSRELTMSGGADIQNPEEPIIAT